MFVEKVFQLVKQFLVKNVISFFAYEYQNFAVFCTDFKSEEIIGKKCTQKKLFAKNLSKLV
jgi:hypothetical protein